MRENGRTDLLRRLWYALRAHATWRRGERVPRCEVCGSVMEWSVYDGEGFVGRREEKYLCGACYIIDGWRFRCDGSLRRKEKRA